jgi:flagellar protein FlaI
MAFKIFGFKSQEVRKPHVKFTIKRAPSKKLVKKPVVRTVAGAPKLKVTDIPEISDENIEEISLTPIQEPYTYVRILQDLRTHEYLYNVIEPQLTSYQQDACNFIIDKIIRTIDYSQDDIEDETEKQKLLRDMMTKIIDDYDIELDELAKEKIFYYVYRDLVGYGKIDVMMRDPMLEDISCDGTGIPLFVFHREYKNTRTNVRYDSAEELETFVIALAQRCGKSISKAEPVLDATIPDGSRLNATLGTEVTTRGSSFTIRKFKEDPLTISDLVRFRTLSAEMAAHLWLAVQYGETMICSGGTASGKTTTLNAVCLFIPPSAKIITIEDTREINLPHENWIAGLTRPKGGEGQVEIDMYDLLRAALRQRPEYMLVGEVRGKETMAVFQAMATGQVCYASMHADSVPSIVHRLENPPINIPRILLLGLNLIILQAQVRVKNLKTRRIKELVEIIGIDPVTNDLITNTVYRWIPARDIFKYSGHSKLYEKIMDRENISGEEILEEVKQRADIIRWMVAKHTRRYTEVASIINEYYRDAPNLVKRARAELDAYNAAQRKIYSTK